MIIKTYASSGEGKVTLKRKCLYLTLKEQEVMTTLLEGVPGIDIDPEGV